MTFLKILTGAMNREKSKRDIERERVEETERKRRIQKDKQTKSKTDRKTDFLYYFLQILIFLQLKISRMILFIIVQKYKYTNRFIK